MKNLNAIVKCMKWTLTEQSRRSSFWALTAAWQLFSLLLMCRLTVFDRIEKHCGEIPLKNVHETLFTSNYNDVKKGFSSCSVEWLQPYITGARMKWPEVDLSRRKLALTWGNAFNFRKSWVRRVNKVLLFLPVCTHKACLCWHVAVFHLLCVVTYSAALLTLWAKYHFSLNIIHS